MTEKIEKKPSSRFLRFLVDLKGYELWVGDRELDKWEAFWYVSKNPKAIKNHHTKIKCVYVG